MRKAGDDDEEEEDEDDNEEANSVLERATKRVCSAQYYTNIPSLADFVTSFKKPSMPNTEFQEVDIEAFRKSFRPEMINNYMFGLKTESKTPGTTALNNTDLLKNYYLATSLLDRYTAANKAFMDMLHTYCNDCTQLLMFSIWGKLAILHFYRYPYMYIFNNPTTNADATAAKVDQIVLPNTGGYYVNLPVFFDILKQNRARFDAAPFLRSWYHFFSTNSNSAQSYIYLFEPVHILRSNTSNFYLGIIAIFTLYWVNNDKTLFP